MAYEYSTPAGAVSLLRTGRGWTVHFRGARRGVWRSPAAAAEAVAMHRSGLREWDYAWSDAPDDLIDWRPLGDSL